MNNKYKNTIYVTTFESLSHIDLDNFNPTLFIIDESTSVIETLNNPMSKNNELNNYDTFIKLFENANIKKILLDAYHSELTINTYQQFYKNNSLSQEA